MSRHVRFDLGDMLRGGGHHGHSHKKQAPKHVKEDSHFTFVKALSKQAGGDTGALNGGIFIVRSKGSGALCVEKRFTREDVKGLHAKREVNYLRKLRGHPNISHLKAYELDPGEVPRMVMTYYELGALDTLIDRYKRKDQFLPEGFLWRVFLDIAKALRFCVYGIRQEGDKADPEWDTILHRDIKPGNIFLTSSGSLYPRSVLGDFGCGISESDITTALARDERVSRQARAFAPPESPDYDRRSDVYQLGLVMHCLSRLLRVPDHTVRSAPIKSIHGELLGQVVGACLRRNTSERESTFFLPGVVEKKTKEYLENHEPKTLATWAFN
ncbi:kinase-like protein [Mytilinidion resinicola]|uniref:non-specific serine/threonine protein kinase n=1 Tax=Mytilinidion resinicola TaxID=574789 RepID=A0A6A6Z6M4_9PEZI|nr:kinase-like protein [Mytilinidion resinicola]KAF2816323.1 kinase-like protein [Mytilinidion resinicola]